MSRKAAVGSQRRLQREHIFNHTQLTERMNWKGGEALSSKPTPKKNHPTNFAKRTINRGQTVEICEPMEDISYLVLCAVRNRCFA